MRDLSPGFSHSIPAYPHFRIYHITCINIRADGTLASGDKTAQIFTIYILPLEWDLICFLAMSLYHPAT
jgi:hypothetical protein